MFKTFLLHLIGVLSDVEDLIRVGTIPDTQQARDDLTEIDHAVTHLLSLLRAFVTTHYQ